MIIKTKKNEILDDRMSQSISKSNHNHSNKDSKTESDDLSPPNKRLCQSIDSKIILPDRSSFLSINRIPNSNNENDRNCKSCGKQENSLQTFNCPLLHHFCLNCIFNWTKKHIQVDK